MVIILKNIIAEEIRKTNLIKCTAVKNMTANLDYLPIIILKSKRKGVNLNKF